MCTWVIDEQSEYLGMELYSLIFKTENKMRAFINKVLTYKFGVKWMELIGLEDIIKGYQRSNVDFKRDVPEFNNINDFLICSTAESLAKLMLKSEVFETSFALSDTEVYTAIDDSEYFSYNVVVSSLNSIKNEPLKQILFSVDSNVDSSFKFDVCVFFRHNRRNGRR